VSGRALSGLIAAAVLIFGVEARAQGPRRDSLRAAPRTPAAPAALARARGWMPLATTGVPSFRSAHPEWDGRGVLIAILDSGTDPGAEGLAMTSTGAPKIADLRDFSTEGTIALGPLSVRGDTILAAGHRWLGMNRIRSVAAGPWYAGLLLERSLGQLPASDLNDDLDNGDSLLVVVGRGREGWVLFADTDGDGSFANDKPVHDFLSGGETFGWHRPGVPTPLTLAVNFAESPSGPPDLHLVFDTEAHGTHVAGIAAGYRIGGLPGFDGVAPGAQILGLKISRNDLGGITTTGSIVAALDYAIRFAARRAMPLVVNLSFGVGNEREGAARLDALLDSILDAHPDVVFVTSAGNDGPGLSTMGFPGSARRVITVGAVQAAPFLPGSAPGAEPLLFFSSRGGELAKPDLVAPGTAYSTVPAWNVGDEFKSGTSMAAPHVAGLAALLLSAASAERQSRMAEDVRRALAGSARRVGPGGIVEAGAGIPQIEAAWRILEGPPAPVQFDVEAADRPGATAAFSIGEAPSQITFRITRVTGVLPVEVALAADVPWLAPPARLRITDSVTVLRIGQTPPRTPGAYTGRVQGTIEGVPGPVLTLASTIVIPFPSGPAGFTAASRLEAGGAARFSFASDSGLPFRVRLESGGRDQALIASLHQPGGQPVPGDNGIRAGADSQAAVFDVDGRDARAGFYEAVAVAPLDRSASARVTVRPAPARLLLSRQGDSLTVRLSALEDSTRGRLRVGFLGAERVIAIDTAGSGEIHLPLEAPDWAVDLIADLEFEPDQWPRFTDFGFAVRDREGQILEKEPANYARTRLSLTLGSPGTARPLDLVLAPGFADPGSRERWKARVSVRWIASEPSLLPTRESDAVRIPPRASTDFHARVGAPPGAIPALFQPLLLFVLESEGVVWTWQLPLSR
jgi:subtilisin family serine protease